MNSSPASLAVGHWIQRFHPRKFGNRLDSWLLQGPTAPPMLRFQRIALVFVFVAVIGAIDYVTGAAISLQVFYLGPITLALIWLGLRAAFITSVGSIIARVGGDYLLGAEYTHRLSIIWNTLGFLATYMIVAWILEALIKFRREMERRVIIRTAALAQEVHAREQLQQELIEISERERRTIGNDLHDGLGQHLTAMAYAAEILSRNLETRDDASAKAARDIVRLAEEGILHSRQLARGLLLTAIEPENLSREMEELAAVVQRQSGVRCSFQCIGSLAGINTNIASNFFRIAEEATRNSVRHASPTALHIELSHEAEKLRLEIRDDGAGLPLDTSKKIGVGLRVMNHRAKLIGGELTVNSSRGQGTRIVCEVPLSITPRFAIP